MTVVCDNHHDRTAVASFTFRRVSRTGGVGALFPSLAVQSSNLIDLCSECAAVLGWKPPEPETPEPEVHAYGPDELVSDAQRRLLFARCRDIGLSEDERHELLEAHAGDPSVRNLRVKDFDRVMVALGMVADRRRLTHGGSR